MKGGNIPENNFFYFHMLYRRNNVLTHNYQSVLAECVKDFRD